MCAAMYVASQSFAISKQQKLYKSLVFSYGFWCARGTPSAQQVATGTKKDRSGGTPGVLQVIDFHCVFDGFSVISNDRLCDRQCVLHHKVLRTQNSKSIKNIVFFIGLGWARGTPSAQKIATGTKKTGPVGHPESFKPLIFIVFLVVLV